MLIREYFDKAIEKMIQEARNAGKPNITVTAVDLHKMVLCEYCEHPNKYPGQNHRMPMCCAAMRKAMQEQNGDCIVSQPPEGDGASLEIAYNLTKMSTQ